MKIPVFLMLCASLTAAVDDADESALCNRGIVPRTLVTWQSREGEDGGGTGSDLFQMDVDEDALQMLENIDSEVAVISIAGGYQMPNSLFLNSLLAELMGTGGDDAEKGEGEAEGKSSHSFPVLDPLSEKTTYALSATLLPGCLNPLSDRPGTALLVVNSPGLNSPRRPALWDSQVLSLLLEISSLVMYSSPPAIGRTDVETMLTALHTAESLDTLLRHKYSQSGPGGEAATKDEKGDGEQEGDGGDQGGAEVEGEAQENLEGITVASSPALVWLVQESVAQEVTNDGEQDDERIRQFVKGLLEKDEGTERSLDSIDVALVPPPVTDAKLLSRLSTVLLSDLSAEYKQVVQAVVGLMRDRCLPKQKMGSGIKGEGIAAILRDSIQTGQGVRVLADEASPSALLDALEEKELKDIEALYDSLADKLELTDKAADLDKKLGEISVRARRRCHRRASSEIGSEGGEEQRSESAPSGRRPQFDAKLSDTLQRLQKEWYVTHAGRVIDAGVEELDEDLRSLYHKAAEANEERQMGADLGLLPVPTYTEISRKLWEYQERSKNVADSLQLEHEYVQGYVDLDSHNQRLQEVVQKFLEESKEKITAWAEETFSGRMKQLADDPYRGRDVQSLRDDAAAEAEWARKLVEDAVGKDDAEEVAKEKRWRGRAEEQVEKLRSEQVNDNPADDKEPDGSQDAGDAPEAQDSREHPSKQEGDYRKDGASQGAGKELGDPKILMEEILARHGSCTKEIPVDSSRGAFELAIKDCEVRAMDEWGQRQGTVTQEDKEKSESGLQESIQKNESSLKKRWAEYSRAFEETLVKIQRRVRVLEKPPSKSSKDDIDRSITQQVREFARTARKDDVSLLKSALRTELQKSWEKKCMEAAKDYLTTASRATSIFSLAPLRYSGPPPFLPSDCFTSVSDDAKVRRIVSKGGEGYMRGTWGRRWSLRLALWAGLPATIAAVLILATGRRLTSSPAAMVFVAAASLQVLVLLLAVSHGLWPGSRLWLLSSSVVLCYVASGADLSGMRGRGGRRSSWNPAGRRASNGGAGTIPLFRSSAGKGAGNGGRGNSGMAGRARQNKD